MSLSRLLLKHRHHYGGLGEYGLPINTNLCGVSLDSVAFPQTYHPLGCIRASRCDEANLLELLRVMRDIQVSEFDALLGAPLFRLCILLIVEFADLAVDHMSIGHRT